MEDLLFGEICRCCMASKPRMKPLFDTNLFAMLNAVTGLNVQQNDGLPSQLCVPCVLQIRRSHFFKVQCENTDTTLRSYAFETRQRDTEAYTLAADGTYVKKEADSSSQIDETDEPGSSNINMKLPLPKKFFCQQCPKAFETGKQLRRHTRSHDVVKPHRCTECSAAFLDRSNLKKHMMKHTGELRNNDSKPHLCSECGKSFKYSTSLSRHKRFHAQRNLFTCTICSKGYVEQTSLDVHMRMHTNERPFMCSTCDKSFAQKANLERHERTHTGEKPYGCDLCGKRFTQKSYLFVHKRIHSQEKPFACTTCTMCFVSRNALQKHQQKPCANNVHTCNVCNKTFRFKKALRLHRQTHRLKHQAFRCELCKIGFPNGSKLDVHMKVNHPEISETNEGEYLFFDEDGNMERMNQRPAKQSHWSSKRTTVGKGELNEEYEDEEGEEEEEEDELGEEEEEDEVEGEEENEEQEGAENISILEDYEEGDDDSQMNEEESVVHVVYNGVNIVEQEESYENFIGDYDAVVKEEPLLEISIMNPEEVDSDIEQ
uniref:Protein krueppel n=1 Tax=Anopheles epiroticus TaxID=199890 RepID=A0A182PLY3_9DIPT